MFKKILIVRFSAFGDLVLTTGPLAQLRKKYPGIKIDLLTSEIGQELFINSIDVDRSIVIKKGAGLSELVKVYKTLEKYDAVIDWQANFKSHFLKLFQRAPFFTINKQSKQRRAFVKNRKYKDQLHLHVVEKYYNTLKQAFPELPQLTVEELRPLFPKQSVTFNTDFNFANSIVLHPYASQKNKEWPYFAELAKQLLAKNRSVIIIGHSREPLALPQSQGLLDLTNKTSIREMAALLTSSACLITTDSGPMHMGVAVKTPTIALFGPTTKEFGFYPIFQNTEVIEKDLDCRPCHVHGGNVCPLEHHKCMKDISVVQVLKQIEILGS